MDYYLRIQKSIDFIEENLCEKISLTEVSKMAYSSLSHFHRIFAFMTGFTIKEYIRKRRMSVAAHELLCTTANVLDIALKYQYNTHETFTRAFNKAYGMNPLQFRKTKKEHILFEKVNIYNKEYKNLYQDDSIKTRFVTFTKFIVAGFSIQTSLEDNKAAKDIPNLWDSFFKTRLYKKIVGIVNPDQFYGIYSDLDFHNNFTFAICFEIKNLKTIAQDMYKNIIAPGNYVVFTAKGKMPETLVNTWHYIYGNWLPNSKYDRNKGIDFELYNNAFKPDDYSEVDIYIPLKIIEE